MSEAPNGAAEGSASPAQSARESLECEKLRLEIEDTRGLFHRLQKLCPLATGCNTVVLTFVAFLGILTGGHLIDLEKQQLALERARVAHEREDLRKLQTTWCQSTTAVLDEASGLSPSRFVNEASRPLVLGVDDEENEIFVLQPLGDGEIALRSTYHFPDTVEIDDLEAICYDARVGRGHYYAIASHRRVDKAESTRVLRFRLDRVDARQTGPLVIDHPEPFDLHTSIATALSRDGLAIIKPNLKAATELNGENWSRKNDDVRPEQPYALEIEGAVCIGSRLLIGLKWPLDKDRRAILLEYNLDAPNWVAGPAKHRRLGIKPGLGISDLAYDADKNRLLVATNPPGKDTPEKGIVAIGQSSIYVFSVGRGSYRRLGQPVVCAVAGSKLEGLAVAGDEIWLAFDAGRGIPTRLLRMPLKAVYEGYGKSLLEPPAALP